MNQPAAIPHPNDIAIVGMSCRFPDANDVSVFWRNLEQGVESISFFSEAELLAAGVDPALLADPAYVRAGAVIDDIDCFDAAFFGYSPREASLIEPQQRIFLECAWEALERAGYTPASHGRAIGVFAGSAMNGYLIYHLATRPDVAPSLFDFQIQIGNDKDYLTTRVSYKLNLTGPSINIQSACSTSLVAVHVACQSLLNGECNLALAGGISIAVPHRIGYLYQEGGVNSADGHCRAFDTDARGTVLGSGAGVVALKRLADALADGDHIHAVIKGSAVNNDGNAKVGYTAPSVSGQAAVVVEALAMAGLTADTIGYIETHGTGTPMGDPIEIQALTQAFRESSTRQGDCAIGSVKTNIGHMDVASGVAGLIKTALMLEHRRIPASLHYRRPNPEIDFANSPFYVNSTLAEWTQPVCRAGVSSFGLGGTNAHVLLEEAPKRAAASASRAWQLILLSARTPGALERMTERLADHLRADPAQPLADIAFTLQTGRERFAHRRMLVCRDHDGLVQALLAGDCQRAAEAVCERHEPARGFHVPRPGRPVSGNGARVVRRRAAVPRGSRPLRRNPDPLPWPGSAPPDLAMLARPAQQHCSRPGSSSRRCLSSNTHWRACGSVGASARRR
jgi:acyl transferase domain-containing protein